MEGDRKSSKCQWNESLRTKELHLAHACLLETLWFKHCSMFDASEHTVPIIWEGQFHLSPSQISGSHVADPPPLTPTSRIPHGTILQPHWTVLQTQTYFQWLHSTCSWGGPLLSRTTLLFGPFQCLLSQLFTKVLLALLNDCNCFPSGHLYNFLLVMKSNPFLHILWFVALICPHFQ